MDAQGQPLYPQFNGENQQVMPQHAQGLLDRSGGAYHSQQVVHPQQMPQTGHMGEVFGGHHVYQYPTQFFFRDKTLITGDFRHGTRVCNPNGSIAFETKDRRMTLRNQETVYDAVGRAIATLHKKTVSLHGTWEIYRGESVDKKDLIAEIRPGLVSIVGKTIQVRFKGSDEAVFVIKGNFLGRSFEFQQNGRVVARCKRHGKFQSATNFLSGEDTFVLECQPGFDTALLVLATLVIDDVINGSRENA